MAMLVGQPRKPPRRVAAHMAQLKPRSLRNLTQRPARPALSRGHVQQQARYAMWTLGEATTPQVLEWCYCLKLHRGARLARWDYRSCARALAAIGATKIDRVKTQRGRPWRWQMPDAD